MHLGRMAALQNLAIVPLLPSFAPCPAANLHQRIPRSEMLNRF
ncbi:hypothetical protein HMPREF9123_2398 [Neisseria bacilliformis ATCC BAA-1200]|uniref:Uncharacterized protein n=1 Tax=Neisseria bacilliformis ATCC BAA-1200 TaxID=888742 RepID=F2BF91_9NEIS|nr:hypothetical protein HMPREF9123_2398 [Neisseria bacilliformis ATCC BAA-1200]